MKANTNRSWRLGWEEPEDNKAQRQCDHPGCGNGGEFRAPRGRDRLHEYYWFCLDHVRAYNAAWNYYAGMSPDEIEGELRRDTTWQRPTWPLGAMSSNRRFSFGIRDPFGLFEDELDESPPTKPPTTPEEAAMRVLRLDHPLTLAALKARYKELVKRHHPDANGGDKAAEEMFKEINQAYTTLLHSLTA